MEYYMTGWTGDKPKYEGNDERIPELYNFLMNGKDYNDVRQRYLQTISQPFNTSSLLNVKLKLVGRGM